MNDMLKAGTQWLADQLHAHASGPVEYWRTNSEPMPLRATTAEPLFKVEQEGIQKVVWTDKDFLFRVADLVHIGVLEPQTGDRIREVVTVGTERSQGYTW